MFMCTCSREKMHTHACVCDSCVCSPKMYRNLVVKVLLVIIVHASNKINGERGMEAGLEVGMEKERERGRKKKNN